MSTPYGRGSRRRRLTPRERGAVQSTQLAGTVEQVAMRTLEDAAKDKSRFIAWLDANNNTPERLAGQLAALKQSVDRRVVYRAVELETKIRGFYEEGQAKGPIAIQFNVNTPVVREAPRIDVTPPQEPAK